ncbi:MAG: valine--tRNA ligase [bacterium]|nr:valine--tRNA ligase [bacterium]
MPRTGKKSVQIPPVYQPASVEPGITAAWEKSSFANPDRLPAKRGKPFSIALPPPNATGVLHAGHAVMLAIQDIVARFQRMRGRRVLWLPGTDHAAIATQAVVEKLLAKEGTTRQQLGREAFLAKVRQFVADSQGTIRKQMRTMGASCDWSRERYTLDDGLSAAVNEAFVRMHRDGLIYRGYRIVNWCPRCHSTLSDDEVEYKEQRTKFYYFTYGPVVIGTARPETKFLDKTIVVHPEDERYRHLVGKTMDVEWIEGKVSANVIADPVVDKDFGSGAMTITPAHSFEDFELAQKHKLPVVQIINEDGNFTQAAGSFAGKNARASRDAIVAKLQAKGLVSRVDEHYVHNLSVCYRCGTPVEPLPSKQWFVNVSVKCKVLSSKLKYPQKEASLKELAAWVVQSGQIEIIPDRFQKTYFHWMDNLRDWCISRQIWFGHRIPVYYCKREFPISNSQFSNKSQISPSGGSPEGRQNSKIDSKLNTCPPIVSVAKPKKCPRCGNTKLEQDPDTLDTWFSSGLWTFSTLGWPAKTKDLKTYHPTSLMETGYDILFFWVARMIIMSTYLVGEVPFRQVYLHGMVRDKNGQKMSKSRPETAIDPLDMIEKYGADAMRLSLVIGTTPGNDTRLWEEKIASYRNFVNKLWNIARFISLTVGELKPVTAPPKPKTLADRWILAELNALTKRATDGLQRYEFSAVGEAVYEFTWSKLADWYLEIAKVEGGKEKMLSYLLQQVLKLWHPFTPFVTEHLWERFGARQPLMVSPWPKAGRTKAVNDFAHLQSVVTAIRNLRSTAKVEPAKRVAVQVAAGKHSKLLKTQTAVIAALARCSELTVAAKLPKPSQAASAMVSGVTIYLPLAGMLDAGKEQERLRRELDEAERYAKMLEQKLANDAFTARAPQQVVAAEREKLAVQQSKVEKLKEQLAALR